MKHLLILLAISLVAPACSNDKCESRKQGSFGSFLDDEWRTYCNEYEAHLTEPLEFELYELSEFFGNHPGKVEELNEALVRFEDVDSCFDTNSKFLEYRDLQNCITAGDLQDVRMMNSFSTAIDPWMEELNLTVSDINPKLNRGERVSTRLLNKASEALDYHRTMGEEERIADHFENIKILKTSITKARSKASSFEQFRQAISPNAALNERIDEGLVDDYTKNKDALKQQNARIKKIEEDAEFIKRIKHSAGKRCPKIGRKRGKETKIAIKTLGSYFRKVESGRIRIDGPIKSETIDDKKTQSFSGKVCGLRSEEIEGRDVTLCAVHNFEIKRVKDGRRWSKWEGEAKEGGLKDGVDCSFTD